MKERLDYERVFGEYNKLKNLSLTINDTLEQITIRHKLNRLQQLLVDGEEKLKILLEEGELLSLMNKTLDLKESILTRMSVEMTRIEDVIRLNDEFGN